MIYLPTPLRLALCAFLVAATFAAAPVIMAVEAWQNRQIRKRQAAAQWRDTRRPE